MIGRISERGSGMSVLAAQHDDDYKVWFLAKIRGSVRMKKSHYYYHHYYHHLVFSLVLCIYFSSLIFLFLIYTFFIYLSSIYYYYYYYYLFRVFHTSVSRWFLPGL